MQALKMIKLHPDVKGNVSERLIKCIEECYSCAQICLSCADACLAEKEIDKLRQCIRLNLDCENVCLTTGALASRRTGSDEKLLARMLETCAMICRMCAEECGKHAKMHEHCRICAESCERCAEACDQAMQDVTP